MIPVVSENPASLAALASADSQKWFTETAAARAPAWRNAESDLAFESYARALEPKKLVTLKGGHFDAYNGPGFAISSVAARDWFATHLRSP